MSFRPHSLSSNLNESTRDSSGKAQSRHRLNVRLAEQNNHYQHNYLPFTIPSSYYNIVHIHRVTTIDTISTLINYFESSYRYSINTESDRFTYDLSLIQVHSISRHLASFIVLFEINHLPPSDSLLMGKIKLLFGLLFRLGKYHFILGFDVRRIETCCSNEFPNMTTSSKSRCICTSNFPYVKPTDHWSLQNAIRYTVNRFLNKSSTKKNWSIMLDPNHSPLSSSEQCKRIIYAIYDCSTVTFLHRAIYEKWSLIELREAELISLFTSNAPPHSSSLLLFTFLEDISEDESEEDDEVIVSFLSSQHATDTSVNTTRNIEICHATVPAGDITDHVSSNQQLSSDEQPLPRRTCRSATAQTLRNRKHNKVLRLYRHRHVIFRNVYHRFTLKKIKNILRDRDVRYVHLKLNKSSQVLSIGMKKATLVDLYFDRLPGDLFDKEHYQRYCRHEH